jgi:hypothetical protein
MRNVVNVSHMVYCQNSESRVISYTPENKDIIEIFMNKSIISLFSNNTYDCLGGVMVSVLTSRHNIVGSISNLIKPKTIHLVCVASLLRWEIITIRIRKVNTIYFLLRVIASDFPFGIFKLFFSALYQIDNLSNAFGSIIAGNKNKIFISERSIM